jgi:hypothetical protein
MLIAIDPSVTAALISAGVSLVVTLATKLWLDRRDHRSDLETEYRHEQRKHLQQLIGRYHGGLLEHAVSWNYRMLNLFANVGEGWLERNGVYRDRSHYYFHSIAYRFLALLGLAQLFEAQQIYIDARYVEKRELEFVKFCKAFHWVMSDAALFKGLDYDQNLGSAHFTSDRLRAICEAFLVDGKVPTFRQFEARILQSDVEQPELEKAFRFFDGLSPQTQALRWDRLVCLHLLTTAFVTTFGYDWQRPGTRHHAQALAQVQQREVLVNFIDWLPRLGLDQQECIQQIKQLFEADTPVEPLVPAPERLDVAAIPTDRTKS